MKKEDLKTGMRVLIDFKDLDYGESFGIVLKDVDLIIFRDSGYDIISELNTDILQVWDLPLYQKDFLNFREVGELIYEKEEQPKKAFTDLNELAEFMQEQMDKLNESVNKLK